MIAGALASYRRGVVAGTRTYGKGCAQEYLDDDAHSGVLRLDDAGLRAPRRQPGAAGGAAPRASSRDRSSRPSAKPCALACPRGVGPTCAIATASPKSPGPAITVISALAATKGSAALFARSVHRAPRSREAATSGTPEIAGLFLVDRASRGPLCGGHYLYFRGGFAPAPPGQARNGAPPPRHLRRRREAKQAHTKCTVFEQRWGLRFAPRGSRFASLFQRVDGAFGHPSSLTQEIVRREELLGAPHVEPAPGEGVPEDGGARVEPCHEATRLIG